MGKIIILLAFLAVINLPAFAANPEPQEITVTGILHTGVVAPGGETTGIVLETKDGKFELSFPKDSDLREKADKLNGKNVDVTGTLKIRTGVEVKERKIITVTKMEEPPEK